MKLRSMTNVLAGLAMVAGLGTGAAQAAPVSGAEGESASATVESTRPLLRVPFNCGRTYETKTGDHHRDYDGYYSVDMNWRGGEDFGTPVLASAGGRVSVYRHTGGYGKHVVVNHGGGWTTLYAHLSQINVTGGQTVGPKTVLGRLGESGNVSGPHLHYAQKLDGVVKPIKFGTSTSISYPMDHVSRVRDCR